MEEIRQSLSSIETDRNAKGEWSFKLKLYKEKDDETDEQLADRSDALAERLDAKYPVKVKDGKSSPDDS